MLEYLLTGAGIIIGALIVYVLIGIAVGIDNDDDFGGMA